MSPSVDEDIKEERNRPYEPPQNPGEEPSRWVKRNDTRVEKVVNLLEANLGIPKHPGKRSALQVLVLTILSQNTTDPKALEAYENLLDRFPPKSSADRDESKIPTDEDGEVDDVEIRMSQAADAFPSPDWDSLLEVPVAEVEAEISVCGLQNSKTATIRRTLKWLQREVGKYDLAEALQGMDPSEAARTLSDIKGIGIKTAAVTLMEAKQVDLCPVDTHVHRICQRLRLVEPSSSRNKTFRELQPLIPEGKGYSLHHNLLTFGRTICTAQNPDCDNCFLSQICHYYRNEQNGEDLDLSFS